MNESVKIFVGCDPNNCDLESQLVLEYSLARHSSLPLDITWMQLSRGPASPFYSDGGKGWRTDLWATPFSGFRWAVPALCGGEGRGIYMDSDEIALADIAELWRTPFQPGKAIIAKGGVNNWRYCVSVFDCAAVSRILGPLETFRANPDSHRNANAFFAGNPDLVQAFPEGQKWNYCDNEDYEPLDDPAVKIVHYTAIDTQPQLRYALPRLAREGQKHWYNGPVNEHPRPEIVALFDREYEEAQRFGHTIDLYRREPFGDFRKADLSGYSSGAKG